MAVLCYIINILAPFTNALGLFGLLLTCSRGQWSVLYVAIPFAIIGLIFGIFAYSRDIPPRWFWSRTANELFSFSVTAVMGYVVTFAAYPLAWYISTDFIKLITE